MNDYTDWFPGHVKPARPGVYERRYPYGIYYCEWAGYQWLRPARNVRIATWQKDIAIQQYRPWRGLTHDSYTRKVMRLAVK